MSEVLRTELLRSIKPSWIIAYLRNASWKQVDEVQGRFSVWHSGKHELVIPASEELKDYPIALDSALSNLSEYEKRGKVEIAEQLRNSSSDIVRLGIDSLEVENGTIPFVHGKYFYQNAFKILEASARYAHDPSILFQRNRPAIVKKFMDKVKLCQTEVGSYIIKIKSPLPDSEPCSQKFLEGMNPDYERRVLEVFVESMHALKEVLEEDISNHDSILESVNKGVNVLLCDSIINIYDKSAANVFSVQVDWSLVRPPNPQITKRSSRIAIRRSLLERLKETSEILKSSPSRREKIFGSVVQLKRLGERGPGEIQIKTAEQRTRRVNVKMSEELYEKAIEAHKKCAPVTAIGIVSYEGSQWWLREPEKFNVANIPGN